MTTSLITGINGQTGSYLAEHLLENGETVWGTVKRNSVTENQTARLSDAVWKACTIEYADLLDMPSLIRVIQMAKPDVIYHLAAQSHVRISFDQPVYTTQTIVLGTLNLLEAIRLISPHTKMLHAASSECFGNSIDADGFQRETTQMNPVSPYGVSKVFGYNICRNYRNAYKLFISNSISFNHESERRGSNFVTAKVCKIAVRIALGLQDKLELGNLEAARAWSHAKDVAKAMRLIMNHTVPDDFVVASGTSRTVRELCDYVFKSLNMNYQDYVVENQRYLRAEELHTLKGDSSKIRTQLAWKPEYTFEQMISEMVSYWMRHYRSKIKPPQFDTSILYAGRV